MKLAVTPFTINSIKPLIEAGADIIVLGNANYANRLTKSFSEMEIQEAVKIVREQGKEIYIELNVIVHNDLLEELKLFIEFVSKLQVDGIIYGDIAVYQIAKRMGIEGLLIYNPETLNTNYYDPIYWGERGIKGLHIAKEITLEDMKEFKSNSPIQLSITGHGYLNMFHSRRPLIENFFKYRKEDYEQYIENRNLRLVEEIRNETYPVFQDQHGTHIFRDKIMESYQEINELATFLDVFIIDGIFKDTAYLLEIVHNYRLILEKKDPQYAKELSQKYAKDHDSGFLFKKTVYDKY